MAEDFGCRVDVADEDGATPLMAAADYARPRAVEALLALGADSSVSAKDGARAIHRAASSAFSNGDPSTDPNAAAAAEATGLLADAEVSGGISNRPERSIDIPSEVGTPFLCACARGAELTIRMLAQRGCDVTARTPAGVGAVTLATSSGVVGALRACLSSGAPTHIRPEGGMTALHVAASHPHCAEESALLVDLLLAAGADPNAEDSEGLKPIHAAAAAGRVAAVERLVRATAPDEGVAPGEWNAKSARETAASKLTAIQARHSLGDAPRASDVRDPRESETKTPYAAPVNEPEYVSSGAVDPEAAAEQKRKGDEAFVRGDDAAALCAYDASLRLDDTNARVFANRAAVKLRMRGVQTGVTPETLESARRDAKTARELDPAYVKAWYREGVALTELGDYESAALAFFEGMQIDGDNVDLKRGFDAAIQRGREANALNR